MEADAGGGHDLAQAESRILAFLERELVAPGTSVRRDDDLLSGELLDSVAVLRLAAFVEEEFRVKIEPGDFVIENFRSVAVLAGYVSRVAGSSGRLAAHRGR